MQELHFIFLDHISVKLKLVKYQAISELSTFTKIVNCERRNMKHDALMLVQKTTENY